MITRTAGRTIEKLVEYAWRLSCAGAAFCCFSQPTIVLGQAAETEALAQVGERIITRKAFEAFKAPIIALTTEGAQTDSAMLRSFVDKTLLLMEASSVGLGEDPVIVEQIEAFKKIQIVKAYKSLLVNRTITVTEEELLDHLQATDRDRAVRVAGLLVDTKEEAAEILDQLEAGADFAQLAREVSVYETRDQGGDTGKYYFKDNTSPALADHIFTMAVGETSEPISFFNRWTIIKILDEVPVQLAQVEDIIRGEVLQRKIMERTVLVVDSLYKVYAPLDVKTTIDDLSQAFAAAGGDTTALDDHLLCTFGGASLTFGDFRSLAPGAASAFLGKLDPFGADFTEADNVDSLLNAALPPRLFLEEGLKLGLDNDSAILATVENEHESLLVTGLHRREVEGKVRDVTFDEARQFFDDNPQKFQTIDTAVITEILVEFEQLGKALRTQIDAGADPSELASQHTIRPGAAHHQGKLELTPYKEVRFPGRWDIVKEMAAGEVVGPIEVKDGFVILVVQERRPPTTKPFGITSQRRAKAYVAVHRARLRYVEFLTSLHQKYGVAIH